MDVRMRDTGMAPAKAMDGEPAFFGHSAMDDHPHLPAACPACGSFDRLTEPVVDEAELPIGLLLVTCAACGREVGELAPPQPAPA